MFFKTSLTLVLFVAVLLLGCTQTNPANATANASVVSKINVSSVGVGPVAVKNGDTVSVDYVGSTNGTVFDTSIQAEAQKAGLPPRPSYEPLQFQVGAGSVVPGFDKAVLGMNIGEEKTAVLPPKDAYGEWNPEGVYEIPRTMFENGTELGVGLQVMSPQGMPGVITNVGDQNVSIDFNHFLAGKTLTFKIILREIVK